MTSYNFNLILAGLVVGVPLRPSEIINSKNRINSFSFVKRRNDGMERWMFNLVEGLVLILGDPSPVISLVFPQFPVREFKY